jgi:hypothetical protein
LRGAAGLDRIGGPTVPMDHTAPGRLQGVSQSSRRVLLQRWVAEFLSYYNTVRLHSAIACITPADKLAGRAEAVWAARREKLAQADARRRAKTQQKESARSRSAELQ